MYTLIDGMEKTMTLQQYLELYDETPKTFGEKAGIHWTQIYSYLKGKFPTPEKLIKIKDTTKGEVAPNDFLDTYIKIMRDDQSKTGDDGFWGG